MRSVLIATSLLLLPTTTLAQVFDRPETAQSNPDFLVQGEYAGDTRSLQVIALGDGEFELVVYEGGLPGAGASANPPRRIEGDADVVADLVESMELEKVTRQSPTLGAKPPVGAVVLFDGTKESVEKNWKGGKFVEPNLLGEGTTSRPTFKDYRLHLEFRTPLMPTATGQKRGNSGIYHQGRYETQILDSFGLEGKNNETGAIYTVSDPSINMCFPPLSWQTYDVDFTAARYGEDGKKISDARMTVRLNGVLVQSGVAVPGPTRAAPMAESPEPGPIFLQNHGDPVRFRNIWVVPVDRLREARRPIVAGFERFYANASEPSPIAGEVLINALACDACHTGEPFAKLASKRGPDLSAVSARVRTDAIVEMIANPHAVKPGTTMPDPWGDLSAPQRRERAEAITSFLIAANPGKVQDRAATAAMAEAGQQLYQSVGCLACHVADPSSINAEGTKLPLGNVVTKYTLTSLSHFLSNPHAVRPASRMPGFVGTPSETASIAAFLLGD